jgi:hypothetical protein
MRLVKFIEFLRRHLRLVIRLCLGVLLGVVLLDVLLVNKEHAHTLPEHWFGFWAGFGFLGCVSIIFVSKWFGHTGIMTREDYYEQGSAEDSEL